MPDLVPAPVPPRLPVHDSGDTFPVGRIFCVGRNYADHARELGVDPDETPPTIFDKPASALVPGGGDVAYPPATSDFHHEVELVVALGRGGRDLDRAGAWESVLGYAVGLDLTRRDLQHAAKRGGQPWDMAKGFDASAPCGALALAAATGRVERGRIWMTIGERIAQDADLEQLIWPVPAVLQHLSRLVTLRAGDLVFTGTPAGVGPLVPGDRVVAQIDGLPDLRVRITGG